MFENIFNYLSEFWNNITEATVGTIEYFQNIGNAVAGALGNIIITLFKAPIEIILAIAYLLKSLIEILEIIIYPVYWFFDLVVLSIKSIITAKIIKPEYSNIIANKNLIESLGLNYLFSIVFIVILVLFIYKIAKILK